MKNKTKIVLYGGTGLSKMLRETIEYSGAQVIAVVDDTPNLKQPLKNIPLFYTWDNFKSSDLYKDVSHFMLAIGNPGCGKKPALFQKLVDAGLNPYTVFHYTSFVADDACVGAGSHVDIHAVVMAQAVIGKGAIIGPNSNVAHDVIIGDFVDLTVGVTICGHTVVGDNVLFGACSVVLPRLKIGNNVTIGAGAVVTKDVPDHITVVGIPAREYIKNDR